MILLILGWGVRQLSGLVELNIPNLTPLLPAFGTIGLILIVLEGSLELELNRSKADLIWKSFIGAFIPILVLAFFLGFLLTYFGYASLKVSLTNVIPLSIISSSIAIPSVKALSSSNREFIIYESSLSDIIGVLFFNFVTLNEYIGFTSIGNFSVEVLLIIAISFVATLGLAYLLNKIDHHIKFAPIILLVILIYFISKIYHLPGLVFILLFGLFLGNLDELKRFKRIRKFNPAGLNKEVVKFKEIIIEATFLVRTLFFLLFGYFIETSELFNPDTFMWAIIIVTSIFVIRAGQLKLSKIPLSPLMFIAPRGLITILLFLSIPASQNIPVVNRSLIIQVIILTTLIMMIGLMSYKQKKETN